MEKSSRGEEKEKEQLTGIHRMGRMTATENAEGHRGRFAKGRGGLGKYWSSGGG